MATVPWPPKQEAAIFLRIKREKGEAAARKFMREHGYGKKETKRRRKKRGLKRR